jgi:hypothetical protein
MVSEVYHSARLHFGADAGFIATAWLRLIERGHGAPGKAPICDGDHGTAATY